MLKMFVLLVDERAEKVRAVDKAGADVTIGGAIELDVSYPQAIQMADGVVCTAYLLPAWVNLKRFMEEKAGT